MIEPTEEPIKENIVDNPWTTSAPTLHENTYCGYPPECHLVEAVLMGTTTLFI